MDLAPDFSEFFASLIDKHVEFVLVGGYALALHGAPRYPGDLDILVRPTLENAERPLSAIEAFGFPTTALGANAIVADTSLIQLGVPPVQLHIMSAISGVTWDEVWAGRETASLSAMQIPFIGRTQFVANKRASGLSPARQRSGYLSPAAPRVHRRRWRRAESRRSPDRPRGRSSPRDT